jgi:hypothetical protein
MTHSRHAGYLTLTIAALLAACQVLPSPPLPLADLETGPGWSNLNSGDYLSYRTSFMQSFDLESDRLVVSAASLGPPPAAGAATMGPMATIPVADPRTWGNGSVANYPEPGLTTSYTVSAEAGSIYRIIATTDYPASDTVVDRYIEEYLVKDVAPTGSWTIADPIVDAGGATDPLYRERMEMHFHDGSVRYETIVKLVLPTSGEDGFAPFDVTSSLVYPDFAYPDTDPTAQFSSVVVYTHDRNTNHTYSF